MEEQQKQKGRVPEIAPAAGYPFALPQMASVLAAIIAVLRVSSGPKLLIQLLRLIE